MFDIDVRLARFCADHLGVIDRAECAALGIDERAIDRRIRAGVLDVVHPGVYRHAASLDTPEGRILAAVKAAGPAAAASGPSAMRLYGVRGEWDERPEITLLGTEHLALNGVRVRRIDRLRPGDVHRRFGVPVLAPPVALLLLGASVPRDKVVTAVHDMVFQRFTTGTRLLDALDVYGGRGRRGTVAFRRAVRSLDRDGKATQTNLELDLLRLLRLHGFPEPVLQHPAVGSDGRSYRLDVAYVEQLLDLEADGDRWHLSEPDRRRDKARDAALVAAGWAVHRFGSPDIHLHPARTLATICRSLAVDRRSASLNRQRTDKGVA